MKITYQKAQEHLFTAPYRRVRRFRYAIATVAVLTRSEALAIASDEAQSMCLSGSRSFRYSPCSGTGSAQRSAAIFRAFRGVKRRRVKTLRSSTIRAIFLPWNRVARGLIIKYQVIIKYKIYSDICTARWPGPRCRPRCCPGGSGSSPSRPRTGSTSSPPSST